MLLQNTLVEHRVKATVTLRGVHPKTVTSTAKGAAEYCKSLNFLGAFVPCKSYTEIPVCPSVNLSAREKKM